MQLTGHRLITIGRLLLGITALAIAIACIVNNGFAFQRQPVPASWPARLLLIDINILALAAAGACLLVPRWIRAGAILLAANLGLWVIALHLPLVFQGVHAAWLGLAECLAVAVAAARIAIGSGDTKAQRSAVRVCEVAFGLSLFAFGAAHLIYVQITASMVPNWLPAHLFWAYFTGAAHIAAGISIVTRIADRWGMALLTVMLGSFALLVNLPIWLAKPGLGASAVDLCFAFALTGSAAIFAGFSRRGA